MRDVCVVLCYSDAKLSAPQSTTSVSHFTCLLTFCTDVHHLTTFESLLMSKQILLLSFAYLSSWKDLWRKGMWTGKDVCKGDVEVFHIIYTHTHTHTPIRKFHVEWRQNTRFAGWYQNHHSVASVLVVFVIHVASWHESHTHPIHTGHFTCKAATFLTPRQTNNFFRFAYRSQIWTELNALTLIIRGFRCRSAFWGSRQWSIIFRGPDPQKILGHKYAFQANSAKISNPNIFKTMYRISTKFDRLM